MSDTGNDHNEAQHYRRQRLAVWGSTRQAGLSLALAGTLATINGCSSDATTLLRDPEADSPDAVGTQLHVPDGSRSAAAAHGLEISPVPIVTEGLTPHQLEQVGYGSYLVNAVADCNSCHVRFTPTGAYDVAYYANPAFFLGGGLPFPFPPAEQPLYGALVFANNLTPDPTNGMALSEAQFVEAMQTGLESSSGQTMYYMPWRTAYRWMTTEDLRAMYAYLTRIPALRSIVGNDQKTPSTPIPMPTTFNAGAIERPLPSEPDPDGSLRGLAIQPLAQPELSSTEAERAFGRGSYLVNAVAGCNTCHGNSGAVATPPGKIDVANYLAGGRVFTIGDGLDATYGVRRTMGTDLIGEANGYYAPLATFISVMTEGKHVDQPGSPPVGYPMRWNAFRFMTEDDLAAIYTYITTVPRQTGASDKRTQKNAMYCASDADCAASTTCNVPAHECIGSTCAMDADCPVCQVCTDAKCASPDPASPCLTSGI